MTPKHISEHYLISSLVNAESEQIVTKAISQVKDEWISHPLIIILWKAIKNLSDKRSEVNLYSLCLEGSIVAGKNVHKEVNEISDLVMSAGILEKTIADLQDHYVVEQYKRYSREIEQETSKDFPDISKIRMIDNKYAEIKKEAVKSDMTDFNTLLSRQIINVKTDKQIKVFKTMFPRLDNNLMITQGNTYILAARPSMGKTSFILQVYLNHMIHNSNEKILFLSLETDKEEVTDKLCSMHSGIPLYQLRREHKQTRIQIYGEIQELLKASSSNMQIVNNVRNIQEVSSLIMNGGFDCVMIDYLGLIRDKRYVDRYKEVTEVSLKLKELAVYAELPVVALHQLNRGVESRSEKYPNLADLRDSGQIEQDAHAVMFLHRPSYYEEDFLDKNLCKLIMAKNKNGMTGEIDYDFTGESTTFTERSDNVKVPHKKYGRK